MPDYFIYSFLIAVFAFVYTNILTQNGEVLGEVYAFFYNVFDTPKREAEGLGYHWLFKMIMQCEKCVAGQAALWSYLIIRFNEYSNVSFTLVLLHVTFITLTIFLTIIIKLIYLKLNDGN